MEAEGACRKGMWDAVSHEVFLVVVSAYPGRNHMAEQLPQIKCSCGPSEHHSSQDLSRLTSL